MEQSETQGGCDIIFYAVHNGNGGRNTRGARVIRFLQNRPERPRGSVKYFSFVFTSAELSKKLANSSVPVVEIVEGQLGSKHWRPYDAHDQRLLHRSAAAQYVVEVGSKAVATEACLKRCAEQVLVVFSLKNRISSDRQYPWGAAKKSRRPFKRAISTGERSTHADVGRSR
ncbi:MAG: hypothetical protein Q7R67_00585 [bacterium]|nr:hypothetical protein [bacterium]